MLKVVVDMCGVYVHGMWACVHVRRQLSWLVLGKLDTS